MKKFLILLLVICALAGVAGGAEAAPTDKAIRERAKNLYDIGDYRAALSFYDKLLEQDPSDGAALDLSAWCLRYLGDRKSAEERFVKALEALRGEDAVWVLIGLGEIYLDGEMYERSVTRFEEAISVASGNEEATERASRGLKLAKGALDWLAQRNTPAKPTPPELTDIIARQQETLLEEPEKPKDKPAKPVQPQKPQTANKPAPAKSAPASTPAVVYGITLGSQIDEALSKLKREGYSSVDAPFEQNGKTYHSVQGIPTKLPDSLTKEAVSGQFYVTAYNDAVLSVIIQIDYNPKRAFDELKSALEKEIPAITGQSDRRGIKTTDNIFSREIGLTISRSYGIWMYVTDKGNGTCRLEIEHIDLANLSHYWMAGGK